MSTRKVFEFEMALLGPCEAMQHRGLPVNETLRQERLKALGAEADRIRAECQPIVEKVASKLKRQNLFFKSKVCRACRNGKKKRLACSLCAGVGKSTTFTFNPGSDDQLKDLLYGALKLPERRSGGKVTTDEEALQSLVALDDSGLVLFLLRFAKLSTMLGTYTRIGPAPDGHVRCVYNPAGAYTGRFSHAEAFYVPHSTNLGNLVGDMEVKRDPLFAVRECIVPDDGEVLLEADLSQSEARIVACLSEDKFLLDNWKEGFDVHRWTAGRIYGVEQATISSAQRYIGKRSRHALNYGEGPTKFWRVVNSDADVTGVAITLTEAKEIFRAYHALHPNLDKVWWSRVEQIVGSVGVLETCFGRVCRFYPRWDPITGKPDADTLRAAVAYEPQSTSVDLLNTGLLELFARERGNGFRVLHQGHDSVLAGVTRSRVRHVARLFKQVLEREISVNHHALVIPVEVFVMAENWSQKERVL